MPIPDVLDRTPTDVQSVETEHRVSLDVDAPATLLLEQLRRRVRDGERQALQVTAVQQDLDGVTTGPLERGEWRERHNERCGERDSGRHARRRAADMEFRTHLGKDWMTVRIHDLEPKLMIGLGLGAVVRELRYKRDAKARRKLLAPQDRDTAAQNVRLPLRHLGCIA